MEIAQAAGEKLKDIVILVGKNYAASLIANAFKPALEDGIAGMIEEAKEALGKAEKKVEDGLPCDPEEKEKDTFLIAIDGCEVLTNRYDKKFMVYDTYVIRIGNVGEDKAKEFYVNAQHYKLRYPILRRGPELVNKDFKDFKAPAFPAEYEFGGTCCFCITKQPGDKAAHLAAISTYYSELFGRLPGYAPLLATHFRVGDDWEAQQAARDVFLDAYKSTLEELGAPTPPHDVEPFTEKEALTDLLQAIADKDFFPKIQEAIPGDDPASRAARNGARSAVLGAIDGALAPFDSAAEAAAKASTAVTKKVQESAASIVEKLKPGLAKIVALIQAKMDEKKESGEEEKGEEKEEKSKPQVGDIAKQWKFEKTNIGKQLLAALDGKAKPGEAVKASVDDIKKALHDGVKEPLDKLGASISAKGGNAFIKKQVEKLSERITNLILEITTLDGFLESSLELGSVIDKSEDDLAKAAGDDAKVTAEIDKLSSALWHEGTKKIAMTLFMKISKLEEKVSSVLSGQPEEAIDAIKELLAHIFEVQLRAFNGIRVEYIRNLRKLAAEAKDSASICNASRVAFKDAILPVLNLLAYHHWIKAYEALHLAAKHIVLAAFFEHVWPAVKSGLDAIQDCIPQELTDMGLKLEPMVRGVAKLILTSGLAFVFKLVFLKFEQAIFAQSEGGY